MQTPGVMNNPQFTSNNASSEPWWSVRGPLLTALMLLLLAALAVWLETPVRLLLFGNL